MLEFLLKKFLPINVDIKTEDQAFFDNLVNEIKIIKKKYILKKNLVLNQNKENMKDNRIIEKKEEIFNFKEQVYDDYETSDSEE